MIRSSKFIKISYVPQNFSSVAISTTEPEDRLGSFVKGIDEKFGSLGSNFEQDFLTLSANGGISTFPSPVSFDEQSKIDIHVDGGVQYEGANLSYTRNAIDQTITFLQAPPQNALISIRVWKFTPFTDTIVNEQISPGGSKVVGGFSGSTRIDVYEGPNLRYEGIHWTRDNATGEIFFTQGVASNTLIRVRIFN